VKQSTRVTVRDADAATEEPDRRTVVRTPELSGAAGNLAMQRLASGQTASGSLDMFTSGGSGALDRLHRKLAPDADKLVHTDFTIGAENHELYESATGDLLLGPDPQPVSDLDQLRQLHQQYQSARATGTITQRREIIDRMIALIRSDPTLVARLAGEKLGDPPNLGDVARHGRQTGRFQPPPGKERFAPLWELESEHVIPKQFLGSFFDEASGIARTRGGPGMRSITDAEYRDLTTVMIYKVAADLKTDAVDGDLAKIRALGKRFGQWIRTILDDRGSGDSITDFHDDATFFLSEMAGHFDAVLVRALRAIDQEWRQRAGQRGHEPGGEGDEKLGWLKEQVEMAHETQLPEMLALLDERISDAAGT
jgi:hypothetical protein